MPAFFVSGLEFTVVLGPIIEPYTKEKKEKKAINEQTHGF